MNIWTTLILVNTLLVAIWGKHVSSDIIKPEDIPEDPCLDCPSFPGSPNSDARFDEFSNFAVVVEMNTSYVAIGTKDAVVFVNAHGDYLHKILLTPTEAALTRCKFKYTKNPEMCFSIVDFILKTNNGEIVCGKISGQRNCWKISGMTSKSIPVGSYYRKGEFAYLNTDDYLFTSFQDDDGYGRLLKQNLDVSSKSYGTKFPSAGPTYPMFISTYEFGEYIYYFFQEYQEDIQSSEKIIYSRVARLCKHDKGGPISSYFKDILTLFSKARLLCEKRPDSPSRNSPIHYNILQRTSYVKSKDGSVYIYGLFKSSDPTHHLSVVCRFSLANIVNVFENSMYYSKQGSVMIAKHPNVNDPRFALKCNASLDTTVITKSILVLAAASPLALDAVKPDSDKPVFMFENTRISRITSESVDTSSGRDSSHVLHMLDSNVIYNAVVPRDLQDDNAKCNVFSKQIISKEPLEVLDFNYIQGDMFVSAVSKVVIVPDAACNMYQTCRQCIQARNPHCAWHDSNSCQIYNFSSDSKFKQDIMYGNFSKLCEKEQAQCDLSYDRLPTPRQKVVLRCKYDGVPTTKFTTLKLNNVDVNLTSEKFEVTTMRDEMVVVIKNYNIDNAGVYSCHVKNTWSTNKCNITLPGSPPQLTCRVTKLDSWLLTCSVSGYPKPRIYYQILDDHTGLYTQQVTGNQTQVEEEKTYRFNSYNEFGVHVGKSYKLFAQSFELAINKTWNNDYADTETSSYKILKSKIQQEIKKLYPDNMQVDIDNVKFRKGSCVASFQITSLTSLSSDIEEPVVTAINNGKLGDMNVYEYKEVTQPDNDHQSTNEPLSIPPRTTIPPSLSPRTPIPSRNSSNTPSTTHIEGTAAPGRGGRSPSDGVSYAVVGVVVTILVLVIVILAVIVGYFCGIHHYFCKHLRSSQEQDSSSEQDEELAKMKRSEKGRESRAKLLRKEEKDGGTDENNKKAHSPTLRTKNDQSIC